MLPYTAAAYAPNAFNSFSTPYAAVPQFGFANTVGMDIPMTYAGLANFNQKPSQAHLQNLSEPKRHHHHHKSQAKKPTKGGAQGKKAGKKVEEDIIIAAPMASPYGYGAWGQPFGAETYANWMPGFGAEAVSYAGLTPMATAAAVAPLGASIESNWMTNCPGW